MSKPASLKNRKVMAWERELDGIYVETAYGFAFDPFEDEASACHVHIYPNAREARSELKQIRPCSCGRCTRGLGR